MDRAEPLPATVARWIAKIATAAIFTVVGWLPKFTGQSDALVEVIPGGQPAVYAIATIELITVVLILIPKMALIGSALAVISMLGAIASHFGPVGFEGDFMGVFIMALVALTTSVTSAILEWKLKKQPGRPEAAPE